MSLFPKIARPCPYIDRLDAVMEGDHCRMCQRQVHDLTALDDAARDAFLSACGGDACVSYVAMVPVAIAAAMVAASTAVLVVPDSAHATGHKPRPAKLRKPPRVVAPLYVPIATAGLPPLVEPPFPPPLPPSLPPPSAPGER